MLDGRDGPSLLALAALTRQLRFLHSADAFWTRSRLFSTMSWDNRDQSRYAWAGFFASAGPNEPMLDDGLMDLYLEMCRRTGVLSEEEQWALAGHLAVTACYSVQDPLAWLSKFLNGSTSALRSKWVHSVSEQLKGMSDDVAQQQFDRWIQTHWNARIDEAAGPLDADEGGAMIEWATLLPNRRLAALNLALRTPVRLEPQDVILQRLSELDLSENAAEYAALLVRLLQSTDDGQSLQSSALATTVRQLRGYIDNEAAMTIDSQLARLNVGRS